MMKFKIQFKPNAQYKWAQGFIIDLKPVIGAKDVFIFSHCGDVSAELYIPRNAERKFMVGHLQMLSSRISRVSRG